MNNTHALCPFSKAILGKWCQCQHSKLADKCSGKMTCTRLDDLKHSCLELDNAFKSNSRFILGVTNNNAELTHANLMKIRCGGLLGMRRVLNIDNEGSVDIRNVIDRISSQYAGIEHFPFNDIVQDIKLFKHRK